MNLMRFVFKNKSDLFPNDYKISNGRMLSFVNKDYLDAKRKQKELQKRTVEVDL